MKTVDPGDYRTPRTRQAGRNHTPDALLVLPWSERAPHFAYAVHAGGVPGGGELVEGLAGEVACLPHNAA